MSATDPTEEGGRGGEPATGGSTNTEENVTPTTPATGTSVPAGSQQQHPPPSPLSGCYLLVVLPEPHTAQHKDLILNRLAKGFLSWDKDSCHVDLEKELQALVAQAPEGEEARNGERLIQYATENLVTEVLIHPQTNTLLQCIRNLLASFTKHRHIIHAGYTFGGNGSWILQDGTFSLADFLDAFSEHEVQRVLRAYENSVTVDIHCAGVGDWTTSRLSKEPCTRSCRVRVNPDDVLTAGVPAITSFTNYVGQYLVAQTLDQLMEPSDVVGNIRFSHPTLYVFPGGQGDAALFGINGFNMLVDGGFARKACFWDFTRHLDRLDAVLVTRINNSNVGGMSSVLKKKKEMHVYPQIGHFFCNLVERRQSNSPDGDKDIDPLILNLTDIGQEMMANLRHINLRPHPCYRDPDPINLYHKVGHGTLDMYVLSPSKDSREVREFMAKWHAADSKLFAGFHKKDPNILTFPIQNLTSICALLVWQPANPEDTITRILFPGSTPQHKIFEGFERLKHLDFLKHPVCSAKSLSPSTSLAALRDKPVKQKLGIIEKETKKEVKKEKKELPESKVSKPSEDVKPQPTPIIPTGKPQGIKAEMKAKKVVENKKIESEGKESKKIEKELKEVKKEQKKETPKVEKPEKPDKPEKKDDETKKAEIIKSEAEKPEKPVRETKPKPEIRKKEIKETKAPTKAPKVELTPKPKPIEKKKPSAEKKDTIKSSPTTPKKTLNGTASKTEISKAPQKAKPIGRSSAALPGKSAKDANNRKVVEQKNIEMSTIKDTAKETPSPGPAAKAPAKPKAIDRKPISRRTKPVSPSKARVPLSPAKSTRSTPTASVKSDKDGVVRKIRGGERGTTDSSTVSTPSGIEHETAAKLAESSLAEKSEDISLDSIESKVLADLKEEREVVEEIEAVLQKAERIEEARKEDHFEGDDEITAEATDKKDDDMTEEDVTAEIEDAPKKESSRKESQELTEEDEYLIVEKEEVYTEDSVQSGEGEQKHVLDEAESEKAKILEDMESVKEREEKEEPEEKGKVESPEKEQQEEVEEVVSKDEKEKVDKSPELKDQLDGEAKEVISSPEAVQKTEDKDDSGKKDSEDITKEPSSLSPDKFDSSEKKTTDTDMKPDTDLKDQVPEKLEESQERISTLESGATTTAPTLPEDERIPLDEIKEDIDEKHVMEEVKEKDVPKAKEEILPRQVPVATTKPEVKAFDVRQAPQGIQREIVKTPDEVADLPVHEEVDPKFYRMEDFEKDKEEKPVTPQETKEPSTPTVKEQKGVLGFFGKVADKFEKGIDKLTKKSKKETADKDAEDKSSSKSSSPKEPKPQEKPLPVAEVDMEKLFPKVGKPEEKAADVFEKIEPTMVDVKVANIKETAAFIKEEIEDARRSSVPETKVKITDKVEEISAKEDVTAEKTPSKDSAPISPVTIETKKEQIDDILKDEGEDAEEIKALLEEASKKFKTVKDSLRDSIESLEEIIEEELPERLRQPSLGKDIVKDTLEGVVERLEEMKPQIESMSSDLKETDKVKFDIPKDEEFEKDYELIPGPIRDVKEAVRDVGEVLAGTAGIEIDDKPKDVVEIVKKVAEVLKEDDFLSDKLLFEEPLQKTAAEPTERKPSVAGAEADQPQVQDKKDILEDVPIPKKVGVTEVLPSEEEVEEVLPCPKEPKPCFWEPDSGKVHEEPCVKAVKEADVTSPVKDDGKDKEEAKKICAEIMQEDDVHRVRRSIPTEDDSKVDVMDSGEEIECVKEVCKPRLKEEKEPEKEIEEPEITFDKKVVPTKAELVVVTPGSTPSSPKFAVDKIYDIQLQETIKSSKLPTDVKNVLNKDVRPEEIIEELIVVKKTKITVEIIEYITIVKRISREQVIYIIQEIIVKKGLPKESVVDDVEILNLEKPITPEKRVEIEDYIFNEYISKGKKITIEVIEEISIIKMIPRRIVIEIVEEIIVKKKLVRSMIVDFSAEQLSELDQAAPTVQAKEEITAQADIIEGKRKSIVEVPSPLKEKVPSPTEKEPEMAPQESKSAEPEEKVEDDAEEEKMVDGFVSIPSSATLISHDRKSSHEKIELAKISPVKSEKDIPLPSKEHEKDAIDDFEAVEQEYKVKGVKVTSPEDVSRELKKEDDFQFVAEEAEDDVSDVIEADEKFVKETKEKVGKPEPEVPAIKEEKLIEKKDEKVTEKVEDKKEDRKEHADVTAEDVSEVSEVIDAKEKYLDEAKEKTEDAKEIAQAVTKEPVSDVIDNRKESLHDAVSTAETIPSLEEKMEAPSRKGSAKEIVTEEKPKSETDKLEKDGEKSPQFQDEPEEKTVTPETAAETKLADATGRAAEPKLDVRDEDKEKSEPKIVDTKELEDQKKDEEPPKGDVTIAEQKLKPEEVKTEKEMEAIKEDLKTPEIPTKIDEKVTTEGKLMKDEDVKISEKPPDLDKGDTQETGTVQRMLVTASSEDGGQETVICPTGTITFSKTVTPDDSLKDTSIKSTPDKDSLHLDKDSLRSDVSTPEKDSISEKSSAEAKDTGKITPEDSLDKSPLGKRESPDLEDSLEKTDAKKPKEVDSGSPSIEIDVSQSLVDEKSEKVEVSEKSAEVIKKEMESAAEKIETAEMKSAEQPQLPIDEKVHGALEKASVGDEKVSEETTKKSISPVEKEIAEDITEDLKSPGDKKTMEAAVEIPKLPVDKKAIEETVEIPKSPVDKKTTEAAVDVPKSPVDRKTTEEVDISKSSVDQEPAGDIAEKPKSPVSTEVTQDVPEKAKTPEEREICGTDIEKPTSLDDKKELEVVEKLKSPVEKTLSDEKPKSPAGEELVEEVKEAVGLKSPVDKKTVEEVSEMSKAAVGEKPKSPEEQKVPKAEMEESKKAADKETTEKPADKHIPEDVLEAAKSPVIDEVSKELPVDKKAIDEIAGKPKPIDIPVEQLDVKSCHSEAPPSETIPSEDVSPAETIFEKSPTDKLNLSLSQISSEQKKEEVDVEATLTEKVSKPLEKEKTPSPTHEGAPLEKAEIKKESSPAKEMKVPELSDKEGTPSPVDKPTDEATVSKSRSPSIGGEKTQEIGQETLKDKSRSASIVSDKGDVKDLKSPIVTDKEIDEKEVLEPLTKVSDVSTEKTEVEHPADKPADRSRSASVVSEKQEEKPTDKLEDKDSVRSRSPSVAGDKVDHVEEPTSKSRAASIASTTDEQKKLSDLEEILSKSRSSSIVSGKHDEKEPVDDKISPSTVDEKVDKKPEVVDLPEKPKSLDIVSDGIPEESKQIDKSRSPSLAGDKAEIKETDTQKSPAFTEKEEKVSSTTTEHPKEVESAEIKSSSVVSDKSPSIIREEFVSEKHDKETEKPKSLMEESPEQKSRSPSIISEHHEGKEITDAKSPSAVSDKSDKKQVVDDSKSPSIASEQLDLKDTEHLSQESKSPSVSEAIDEKSKSPSITSDKGKKDELQDMTAVSFEKSPVIEGDKVSAKTPGDIGDKVDVTDETKELIDKSRSASIVSAIDEKESIDTSKPMDNEAEKETSESKSPISDKTDEKKEEERIKSPSTAGDKPEISALTEQPTDKSRSASIVSATDQKEPFDRSKSPSVAGEKPDLKDVLEPVDKSRSASIISTTDHKESADRSKSPGISEDKSDLKDALEQTDKSRSASIASVSDHKEPDRSKSPSVAGDKPDLKDVLEPADKSRSASIVSTTDHKESTDRSKSPSVAGDKPDLKDVLEPADKSRSASIVSATDHKESTDRSKSPSDAGDKPELKDVLGPADKSQSDGIASTADHKEPDHSKSPSIAGEKPDLKDVLEPTGRSRSASIASGADQKESTDLSKSPSVAGEKPDFKDVSEPTDKSRSASIASIADQKEPDHSKSPNVPSEKPDLKDVLEPTDKSRSPSIASGADQKESTDLSKSPSVAGEKPDLKDVSEPTDKSRSASIASIADQKEPDHSKSPSVASEKPDLKDVLEPTDKSRSASIASAADQKESTDHSKSPSVAGEKPDLKDVLEPTDKSRSASITSAVDQKEPVHSKSPSVASEKPDLKDVLEPIGKSRSASIASAADPKESTDLPKSPSVAGEKPDLKDVSEPTDKSTSASIASIADQKEPDHSKSPSVASEKPDLKDVLEPTDKSRSASIASAADQKESTDHSKSPSVAGEKLDLKDVLEPTDKSRSASITSVVDQKQPVHSKSPSVASETPDLKDVLEPIDKSRSASIASAADQKESTDLSKSPSVAGEKPDLKDVSEPTDKSRSASIASIADQKEPDHSKSPSVASEKPDLKDVLEPTTDKSRSASIASAADQKESTDLTKSPSVAGDKPDLKDVLEPTDKSRSASIASAADQKESTDHSKSPSVAGEKPDLKDVSEPTDKSRSASIASIADQKEPDHSKSPSVASEKPDLKDVLEPTDKSRSASIASAADQKESTDHSKSPSVAGEKPDLKDVLEPTDKSRSASITSVVDQKEAVHSKSPSVASEKPDLKDVLEPTDKSRSDSIASAADQKESTDLSKSPSVAGEKPDLKDVREPVDKSRSGSIVADQKEFDLSKSPSAISITSTDKQKSPSAVSEKDELLPTDRAKSPSVKSDKSDEKEPTGDSRTPSIAGDKVDHKDFLEESAEKSKSPSLSDDKISVKETYEDAIDKSRSPSVASEKFFDKEPTPERKFSDQSVDKSDERAKSPSVVGDKPEEAKDEKDIKKSRASSVASEKQFGTELTTTMKPPVDKPLSPSVDKVDQKTKSPADDVSKEKESEKSKSASIGSEEPDESKDIHSKSPIEDKPSTEEPTDDKHSRDGSPTEEKTPLDRSRSHSVFETGEKTPLGRSRAASLYEDKTPEKLSLVEEVKATLKLSDPTSTLEEKEECQTSPKKGDSRKSSAAEIGKDKVDSRRSSHVTEYSEKHESRRSSHAKDSYATHEADHSEETDEGFASVEKKAEIEKYIIDEYVTKKKKITVIIVEQLVMMYSVPKFVVMDVIEDVIQKKQIPRESIMDFDETPSDTDEPKVEGMTADSLPADKKADIEKYIIEEFINKNKKISSKTLDEVTTLKAVPRYILIIIIEEIIINKKISKMSVIESDLMEEIDRDKETPAKKDGKVSPSVILESEKVTLTSVTHETGTHDKLQEAKKPGDGAKLSSLSHDKLSEVKMSALTQEQLERDSQSDSKSLRSSRESIASDKSTQNSPARSEPHIDEEVSISEEKRREVEKLLEEEYVKKSKKITDVVLEEIIMRTGLPLYIILEIVEEIILKKKLVREDVISVDLYPEDETDDLVMMERYESKYAEDSDHRAQLGDSGKSSGKMSEYPEADDRNLGKSISGYSMDYESPFHKAFVGGMTEIRTTHITTLSGKSTPDFTPRDGTPDSASEPTTSTIERAQVSSDQVSPVSSIKGDRTVITQVLRDTKISEPVPEEPATVSKDVKTVVEEKQQPEVITKIVKREIIEQEEPEIITKVIKREVIEQEEPDVISKVIKHEIVVPEDSTDVAKDIIQRIVSGEESTTTKVTKVVTDESSDSKASFSGSGKPEIYSYTIPSGPTTDQADAIKKEFCTTSESSPVHVTKIISRESTPEVLVSADVKRIVTTVTTITEPDGTVTTKKDVKESIDTMDSAELEKLIDSVQSDKTGKVTTETKDGSKAEKIVKETIMKVTSTSGTSTPDVKTFYDSGKSTPDWKQEEKSETTGKDMPDKGIEHAISPLVRDLISDDKSYSGKSSPDISLPKDIVYSGSTGKSTPEVPVSPLIRDGAAPHFSGRSTPDRRSDRSATATPEGFRSGEVIRTIITTTRTMSEEGEIITMTKEVTETTNEKGETVILAEKTDTKVDDWPPGKDTAETAISSVIGSMKPAETRGESAAGSDVASELDIAVSSPPSSPLSTDSHKDETHRPMEFATAAMTSSFYGEMLPEISPMMRPDPIFPSSPSTGEKEYAGGHDDKRSTKKYVDEADMDFEKALMDRGQMRDVSGTFSSDVVPRYTNGSLTTRGGLADSSREDRPTSSSADARRRDSKKDPLEDWGSPLGLPSPKPPRKFNLKNPVKSSSSADLTPDSLTFDVVSDWGEPLRLPSPAPVANEVSNKGAPATPKKDKKQAKKVQSENIKNKKRSESPGKNEKKAKDSKNKVQPVYMDLTYVPHHGNSYYTSLEFFKRVRARYYVFSGTEPSREVYDALLDAKKTWEDKDLEVTMIPTYDTDTLGYWVADNEEVLAANRIDLSPSASRCTINLQDHETSCSAYRLEF